MSQRNYYEILGVNPNSTFEEIKKKYIELSAKYHPDINPKGNDPQKMVEINLAYEVLSDKDKRNEYDEYLNKNIEEKYTYQKIDGVDIITQESINLFDVLKSGEPKINLKHFYYEPCSKCKCSGILNNNHYCNVCEGVGRIQKTTTTKYEISILEFISKEKKIFLEGAGQPGMYGGRPGNLYINFVLDKKHNYFKLSGPTVYLSLKVSFIDIVFKKNIMVPTIYGERIPLIMDVNFFKKGYGALRFENKGYEGGDMLVKLIPFNPGVTYWREEWLLFQKNMLKSEFFSNVSLRFVRRKLMQSDAWRGENATIDDKFNISNSKILDIIEKNKDYSIYKNINI
ncbi:DnaJ domain-containing protein [Mycoplasma sp. CSL7491-lung]|uniref:DnaJ domain-containing protein n=1 Tax=Mycoplasma sp. CSL7491-lung TaxID=549718 RepID=UPI001C124EA9|nr:DnaJ domain-containing protein [Mycoplasma sp. CSL7491-lung]MBU4692746.1 DnaJ domain-containing protein [Mycoplasma sp. CSL7491-lung]